MNNDNNNNINGKLIITWKNTKLPNAHDKLSPQF